MVSRGRRAPPSAIQYADPVPDPRDDDPLFIVPAVVPDDEPVADPVPEPTPTPTPPPSQATSAVTQVAPVVTQSATAAVPLVSVTPPQGRLVGRTIRHIDPFSVFKVMLVFHFVLYLTLLLTGVLLWNVANATGTVDNVERFMESFGWDTFEFNGGDLFHQAWILGLFAVVGLTGIAVLAATTFNLITDLVGGVKVTVLEKDQPG